MNIKTFNRVCYGTATLVLVVTLVCISHCLTNGADDPDFLSNLMMGSLCLT